MISKRLLIALPPLMVLAACGENAPADDSRSASGEVLEGTVSDAMLPLDTVKSEPPFEDPKAAREAQEAATAEAEGETESTATEGEAPEGEATEAPAPEPTPETEG